ncbi:hypothetical protein [Methylosinus sporium]|uniref:hypothetical protein n=1 Tax=Methylosinus sporium TaxID=428 RepID=UPI001FCF0AD7|nr:hypothetical protein [Methylosinus sporium]
MQSPILAILTAIVLAAPCHANDAAAPNGGLVIGGEAPRRAAFSTCVDVQIGNDLAFGCLNRRLRSAVDKARPFVEAPPVDARSSDLKTGVVNMPAIRQQYGPNFGVSVIPYRMPAAHGGSPILQR